MDAEKLSKMNALAKSLNDNHLVANMDEGIEKAKEILGIKEGAPKEEKKEESKLESEIPNSRNEVSRKQEEAPAEPPVSEDPSKELKTVKELFEDEEKGIEELKDKVEEIKEAEKEDEKEIKEEGKDLKELKSDVEEEKESLEEAKESAECAEEEAVKEAEAKFEEKLEEEKGPSQGAIVEDDWGNEKEVGFMEDEGGEMKEEE